MSIHQKIIDALGEEEFEEIKDKTVTVAGLGSVGSAVAESLARTGINIRIIDMGRIEEEDLCTLSLFVPEEDSKFKAKEGKKHIEELNPRFTVKSFHEKLEEGHEFLLKADAVVDCMQDWETSKLINEYCKDKNIPLVYTRVAGNQGLVLARKGYPYTKLEEHVEKIGSVEDEGLLPQTVHQVRAVVLTKVFKILTGQDYSEKLAKLNSWKNSKTETSL